MLTLVFMLWGAVLEVEEAEEIFPGSASMVVQHLLSEFTRSSGCGFDVRWCETQRCSGSSGTPASELDSKLHIVAGVERMHVVLEPGPGRQTLEEVWPSDPSTWRERAQQLARAVHPHPVCESRAGLRELETSPTSIATKATTTVLALSSVAALGLGIGLHILAGHSASRAEAAPLWGPEVESQWEAADAQRWAGSVSLFAALGLAGAAVLWQLATH